MRCRELHRLGVVDVGNLNDAELSQTADRLMYSYALEMVSGGLVSHLSAP